MKIFFKMYCVKAKKMLVLIWLLILFDFESVYSQTDMIESKTINWEKIYSLVTGDKLPKLSINEEKKILEETDKILIDTKSLHSACNFLITKVSENYRNRYLVVGNEKIKEKLVRLFITRRQCELKESIRANWQDSMTNRNDISEEKKKKILESIEKKKELMTNTLDSLITKDGDNCLECYLYDPELKKLLTPPPGQEREFEPEGVYYSIEAFYSVALSTFLPGMYDYLWLSEYDVNNLPYYPVYFYIVKIYPKEFLNDISQGFLKGTRIYRKEGEGFRWEEIFDIISLMVEHNSSFVEQRKDSIKSILSKYFEDFINSIKKERDELLSQIINNKERGDLTISYSILINTYRNELNLREKMYKIYEQIGEKEDIENIKQLGEGIALDYPVRETNREFDEKQKEKYLQQVKDLQERVKALIERLSQ